MDLVICLDCHGLHLPVPGRHYHMCESCHYEGGKSWYGKGFYGAMDQGERGINEGLIDAIDAGESAEREFRQGLWDGENHYNATYEEMNPVHLFNTERP